jgi:hypothetical protein
MFSSPELLTEYESVITVWRNISRHAKAKHDEVPI